jgi:quinol monooxygenase YgiN
MQMNADALNDGESATMLKAFAAELRDPAEPLALLVRFTVKASDAEKAEAAFGRARPLTLKEPGCRAYELNRDPRNPGGFVVYEQWRSIADLDEHFKKDYFARVKAEIGALIVGQPEFRVLLPAA